MKDPVYYANEFCDDMDESSRFALVELIKLAQADARRAGYDEGRRKGLEAAATIAVIPQGHYGIGSKSLPWWNGEEIANAILALLPPAKEDAK